MIYNYLTGIDKRKTILILISIVIQLFIILIFTLKRINILYVSIIPICFLALIYFLNPFRFLLLTFFILIVSIPMSTHLSLPLLPMINAQIFLLLIILALFLSYLRGCLTSEFVPIGIRKSWINTVVVIFALSIIIGVLTGILKGNQIKEVILQAIPVSLYIFGFFFVYLIKDENNLNKFLNLLLISISLVGIEYVLILYTSPFPMIRVYSYQQTLFIFGLPLCISYLLNKKVRGIPWFLITLPPIFVGIVLSQTRGLWIASGVVLLTMSIILITKQPTLKRKILLTILFLGSLFSISLLTFHFLGAKSAGVGVELLKLRLLSLMEIGRDPAVVHRFISFNYILDRLQIYPLFGEGFGSFTNYSFQGQPFIMDWTDNSYLMLWWKLGILGLVIYLALIFEIFRENLYIFRHAKQEISKVFSTTMLLFIPAFLVWGFSNPLFLKYLYNFIWGTVFGLTVITYHKIKDGKLS